MSHRSVVSSVIRKCIQRSTGSNNIPVNTVSIAPVWNRSFSSATLPESVKRVGIPETFPNEYPGQNYEFNWALNFDGVTPLKKSAFRLMKSLDVKIAGLTPSAKSPLKVDTSSTVKNTIPEAGSDQLPFETFDEVAQRTKDLLSLSDHLYCPEGHMPTTTVSSSSSSVPSISTKTRLGVRIITNSASLAPNLLAYLERAPKRSPSAQPITAYVLDGVDEPFHAYAIEEVVDKATGENKSVAALVIVGKKPTMEVVVAGLELCAVGLLEDEVARATAAADKNKQEDTKKQ